MDVEPSTAPQKSSGPFGPISRAFSDLNQTKYGNLILNNLWPAWVFALLLIPKLDSLVRRLQLTTPPGEDPLRLPALLVEEAVTVLFSALVVILFVVRAPVKGRRATPLGAMVALSGTLILTVVAFLPVPEQTDTTSLVISAVVTTLGTIFTIWSLATLGRHFGVFPEARGLVTEGPYQWVRHPIYVGEIISGFGIVIAKPAPAVLAVYVLFVLLQYWRAILEERALEETFPAQFPSYRARTGRLVPRWHS